MSTLEAPQIQPENREGQERKSLVTLHFMRHGEKESDKTKNDTDIVLTAKGREQAMSRSVSDSDINQSVAFGSPRKRTQETAALAMSGCQDEITGTESFDELKNKIENDIKVGTKISIDKRLDFNDDFSTPYGKELLDAFMRGELLKFLAERSDIRAEELKDEEGSTYSRMAKGVAEIVLKYVTVSSRWHGLVNDPDKNYSEKLERFFGSHQGLLECFLAKVIEKTQGQAKRDEFVSVLDNKGFDFTEGFNVEIIDTGNPEDFKIHITYNKDIPEGDPFVFDEDINIELLKDLAS